MMIKSRTKYLLLTGAVIVFTCSSVFTAYAGFRHGEGNSNRKIWYDNGDGTYPRDGWYWLDDDGDGIAECYYFDYAGWLQTGGTSPDGYALDKHGAWTENGHVVQKPVSEVIPYDNTPKTTDDGAYTMHTVAKHQFYVPSDLIDVSDKITRYLGGAKFQSADKKRAFIVNREDRTSVAPELEKEGNDEIWYQQFMVESYYGDYPWVSSGLKEYPSGKYFVIELQNQHGLMTFDQDIIYDRIVVAAKSENYIFTEFIFADSTQTMDVDAIMNSITRK